MPLQIAGAYDACKQAVHMVTEKYREGLQKGLKPFAMQGAGGPPPGPPSSYGPPPPSAPGPVPPPGAAPGPPPGLLIETVYRILVPESKVGGLIGKGGDVSLLGTDAASVTYSHASGLCMFCTATTVVTLLQ